MLTAQDQTEKLWEMARRMEPHLIRHRANMDKLMSLLMVHELVRNRAQNAEVAAAAGGDGQAEHKTADVPGEKEHEQLWDELCRKESYEAKVAQAIVHLVEQIAP